MEGKGPRFAAPFFIGRRKLSVEEFPEVKLAVFWFRRDLRLTDNTALTACAAAAERVVPVYVLSRWRAPHAWTGPHRQAFLCGSLEALRRNLEAGGGRLIFRQGNAVEELVRLVKETGAEAVFFNRDPDPFGRSVEARLAREGEREGFAVRGFKDVVVHEGDEIRTAAGGPFRVFTAYARAWERLPKPQPAGRLRRLEVPEGICSLDHPTPSLWGLEAGGTEIEPGERAARRRLSAFLAGGISEYARERDSLSARATSRISQDLRFGLLSIREVVARCRNRAAELPAGLRASAVKFLSELIWREFFFQILWHFPEVLDREFQAPFRGLRWPGTEADFARWAAGETGFPIVDAAMRQLDATGCLPNRARMIAAMFLTKDLLVDWRRGERYFLQQLTDGEVASNNGGWQWCAGTGADAAPYFRIQNPWTQARRHDPRGIYIKHWVPELRDVPPERFFAPPPGGRLTPRYPPPMVDHAAARRRALEWFAQRKKGGAP